MKKTTKTMRTKSPRAGGSARVHPLRELESRLAAFLTERYPFATKQVMSAVKGRIKLGRNGAGPSATVRTQIRRRVADVLATGSFDRLPEPSPRVSATHRVRAAAAEVAHAVEDWLHRDALSRSITEEERLEILRGMVLTRAVDNQLKAFFLGGEVRYGRAAFQGKGFRSLGQEAIYAAPLRLRRGEEYLREDGSWGGDVVAPLIRDLGAALAMRPDANAVGMVLRAQMGKAGPPMGGKDLHIGDFDRGILPATAPLSISTLSAAGMAMGFAQEGEGRVAVSFIGEGGTSLGEWHEAINLCAAARLPAIFCVQNNQTALSTPLADQSAVRLFADKAAGYGMPGITVDGTDPDQVAAAFAAAADRARRGAGPTLIELVSMRMCGHAHHDDMLYLGREPQASWNYPGLTKQGYADRKAYAYWAEKDPIKTYAARLEELGILGSDSLGQIIQEAESLVKAEAAKVIDAPWPDPDDAGRGVFANEPPRCHVEVLEGRTPCSSRPTPELPPLDCGPAFDSTGRTFLEAVMLGVGDALDQDERVFVYGQDVGGNYGNAFLLLRPLLEKFGNRIVNSPLSEGGILGVCVGAALAGRRPIGEIQFNDFVATGFNQLVNNAAKLRYRWGGGVPMVVRLPWGGLRHAGPYHSQNTEAWFYRTPGLKIVVPSTPHDARALMASAVADPDPVLYYEHIALYRNPKIKQPLDEAPEPLPLGRAALRRRGSDLALISYGAFVHRCMEVAERLAADGFETSVLDLRTLAPLDREAVLTTARHCGKVLITHEDTRTGGIGESLAAIIQEEAFEDLDAPVRIVGSLDTPVPYSPPLEERFLPDLDQIERAARLLLAY